MNSGCAWDREESLPSALPAGADGTKADAM
jgi:hypothetical protein